MGVVGVEPAVSHSKETTLGASAQQSIVVKTLHLLRHAKSSWDEEGLDDFDRPLNDRGRCACAALATHLADESVAPDLVLCSPSRRTRETLEAIESSLGGPRAEFPDRLYGAGAGAISEIVAALPAGASAAMLIGHNPGIEEAALRLARSGADLETMRAKYPTGALATIAFDVEEWHEAGSGVLSSFVRPRDLA